MKTEFEFNGPSGHEFEKTLRATSLFISQVLEPQVDHLEKEGDEGEADLFASLLKMICDTTAISKGSSFFSNYQAGLESMTTDRERGNHA